MPPVPPSPGTTPAPTTPLPDGVRVAVDALHAHLRLELGHRVEAALGAAQRKLHHLGEVSTGALLEAHWHDNLRRLVENRQRLLPRLLSDLRGTLDRLRDPPPAPTRSPTLAPVIPKATDLRLVEEAELDEAGMLDELGRRQEARAGLPLLLLGQRFGVLAAAPAFGAASLPVGARALAAAFMEAAGELGLDEDARKILLRAFEREALADYPAMADTMNAVLDRSGVLPGLSYVPLRPRPAPGSTTIASTARPHVRDDGSRDEVSASAPLLTEDRRMAQMRQWMAERRHLLARLSGAANRTPAQVLGEPELDNVLAALQVGPLTSRSTARLRQAIQEQAQRMGTDATVQDRQADSLALFGDLHMRLHERVDPSAHSLLAGLQVPLLRVAVRDPGFLVQPSAPPRRLLATIVDATAGHHGPEGLDPQLLERMQEVVRELALKHPHDPEVFEQACSTLEEPGQAALRRAEIAERRHVEAARGRERLLSARRSATAALTWAMGEQDPPVFLRNLLEQAWTDALSLVALRSGTSSPQWHEHMETTAAISRAIRDGQPADALHVDRAREALGLIGYHPDQAQAIAGHLTATGNPDADPASRTELVLEMKERSRLGVRDEDVPPGLRDGNGTARTRSQQEWESRLALIPDGHWLEFDAPERPGGVLRLRLAWRGQDSGRVLLLNVRGHPPAEPPVDNVQDLARMLAAGQARLLGERLPEVLEHAWRSMVDGLQPHPTPLAGAPSGTEPSR